MPRGEETQEVPQEGEQASREVKAQDEVKEQEAKRDQEVVEAPQAVVERERPVEESEAIEAAVVEAIEAVPEDGGPKTEDREGKVADTEEISAKPINKSGASAEVSSNPIPLPSPALETPSPELNGKGEGRVPVTEASAELDGKGESSSAGEAETNPLPMPSPAQESPAPNWEEEPPRPPQGTMENGGEETEDREGQPKLGEQVMNEEELQTIRSDGQIMQSEEEEEEEEEEQGRPGEETMVVEEELQSIRADGQIVDEVDEVILDEGAFKVETPTSAQDIIEGIEGEDAMSKEDSTEIENDPIPMPSPTETFDEIETNPVPMPSPAASDGEIENDPLPLPSPSETEGTDDEGGSILIGEEEEELQEFDLTAEAAKEVKEYWEPPEMYAIHKTDGTIILVDKHGNSIESPPHVQKSNTGNAEAWYPGAKSGEIFQVPIYHWPSAAAANMYAYYEEDGSVSIVDQDGNLISNPPHNQQYQGNTLVNVYDDGFGQAIELSTYVPSTKGIYAYKAPDGSIDIVDKNGNLVKCPPYFYQDGADPNIYLKGGGSQPIIIPEYDPPLDGIYLYKSQDGSYSIVDKNGKPVKSPPHLVIDGMNKPHIQGENYSVIELKKYQPPQKGIFVYTAQDGSVSIVDKNGNQVDSPPHLDVEHGPWGPTFHTPDGSPSGVDIPSYQAPINDIYIHLNQDGSIDIVDENGKMIESPPNITFDYDPMGKPIYHAKYAGMPVESSIQLKYFKPPSSHWDKK